MALTIKFLDSRLNKPHETITRKADSNGLGVRISKLGKITFTYRYRYADSQTSIDLGQYPAVSLKEAREKVEDYRLALSKGKNPAQIIKSDRVLETIKDYSKAFCEDYFEAGSRRKSDCERIFRLQINPHLGKINPAQTSTQEMMQHLLRFKTRAKKPTDFYRAFPLLKQMLAYATKFYNLPYSPIATVTLNDFNVSGPVCERFHLTEELGWLMNMVEMKGLSRLNRNFFLLCLYSGCRINELRMARIRDINLETREWMVPKSKTGKPIVRVFPSQAMPIILEQIAVTGDAPYLFSYVDRRPMDASNLSYINKRLMKIADALGLEMEAFSLHDLRRSLRSNVNQWVSDKVAELMLGHTVKGIEAVYNKYEYIDEMRKGYQAWADYLDDLKLKYPAKKKGA